MREIVRICDGYREACARSLRKVTYSNAKFVISLLFMIEQIRNVTRRIQIQMLQILVDTNFAYSESKFHKSVQTEEHLNQVKVHLQLVQLKEMVSIELMTRETLLVTIRPPQFYLL